MLKEERSIGENQCENPSHRDIEDWAHRTLHVMRQQVINSLRELSGESPGVDRSSGDEADLSAARAEHEGRLSALCTARSRLSEIDAAIKRLAEGEYGICQATGEEIPFDRLRANPLALYTVEHQSMIESLRTRGMSPPVVAR